MTGKPIGTFPARPLILGHRGAPRIELENTLISFSRALALGADGVEIDIQRSQDGVPVVVHDETLDRTTRASGRVADLRWGAIERLSGALVPSFDQVSAWAAASGAWLNVELKAAGVERAILELLHERKLEERTVISSFDPGIVHLITTLEPELPAFLLAERFDPEAEAALRYSGARGLCLHVDAAQPEILENLHDRGLPVIIWTVNDPGRLRELLRQGVAGVITDDPEMAARERDTLHPA